MKKNICSAFIFFSILQRLLCWRFYDADEQIVRRLLLCRPSSRPFVRSARKSLKLTNMFRFAIAHATNSL